MQIEKITTKEILDFYRKQGERTAVGAGVYENFPEEVEKISEIIQGLLIHPGAISMYKNLSFSEERLDDRNLRFVGEILDKLREIEDKPLTEYREPQNRIVNICRQFAMVTCSVLREKGIPARCRCGFANYFQNGWFEDHWICEYWNEEQKRWVRVDSQIDGACVKQCHIDLKHIDPQDLLKEAFFSAGVLWKLYRNGLVSGELCGYSLRESAYGEWYIRGNMLRDYFALNKTEYLYSEVSKLMDKNYTPNEEDMVLLDKIAEMTVNIDAQSEEFLKFHEEHKDLIPVCKWRKKF